MGVDRRLHLVRALAAAPAVPLRGHPRPHSRVRLTLPSVDIDVGTELSTCLLKLSGLVSETRDYNQQRPSQELVAKDLHDTEWKFRHIYRVDAMAGPAMALNPYIWDFE
ncbi:hypothetical protein ZWY2020_054614 [Hordeum vulgare]|nr:hypothetical protein ZWY2020_054614 [Hordeum vulgare]